MKVHAQDVRYETGNSRLIGGVSLEIEPGELVAVVGPNGAGKSTLLRLLAGDLSPTGGTVTYDGAGAASLSIHERALQRSLLGQSQAEEVAFSVSDVVGMGRYPYRNDPAVGPRDDRNAVASALSLLDLGGLEHRPVAQLSGGERQRTAIARTLAQETPLVLLDEPTTALDIGHQQMILGIMHALSSDGRTVVAVLHDLNMATAFDRVMLLVDGSVSAYGAPDVVLTSQRLTDVYDHPITVVDHPLRSGLLVLPSLGSADQ